MRHRYRFDLPKGHIKDRESETECALREFHEETGIPPASITLDKTFRFANTYIAKYKRFGNEQVEKTVIIFLGWLKSEADVKPTEHLGYEWIAWDPPHRIQSNTINPLLADAQHFFENSS